MKLGIKTTDGVSKLKTKTTDGVVKAVECACCKCDPYALWGPGYDDQPSEIQVLGYTVWRVGSCQWRSVVCGCYDGDDSRTIVEAPECPEGCDYYDGIYLRLPGAATHNDYPDNATLSFFRFVDDSNYVEFFAIRTGGDHPAPYGIYTVIQPMDPFELYETITISPPPP
jgi:hypothetical protein